MITRLVSRENLVALYLFFVKSIVCRLVGIWEVFLILYVVYYFNVVNLCKLLVLCTCYANGQLLGHLVPGCSQFCHTVINVNK